MSDDLEAWLRAGADSGEPARKVHETPIAKVFVFAERVLKLKKPVDFGFLDFTTLDKREWAARRELDFNRAIAPDVYRTVHPVTRTPGGGFALGGERETVEWLVEMRPFADDALLSDHPERVDGALAERLGREVARAHAKAPRAEGRVGLGYVLNSNAGQLRGLVGKLDGDAVSRVIVGVQAAFARLKPLLDRRRDEGFVRRCHGDLHLGNVVVEDGKPILFDCIEFNDALSEIDVGYDLAFLLMDLAFRDRADAANRVLNAWADEAARSFGTDRLEVLAALPLFQSVRAAVRAHVSAHGGKAEDGRRYLAAAQTHLQPPTPHLYAVGGLSGSGKSTLARALAPRVGVAPGALVLRSDEIRKRLFCAAPTDRLPKSAYAPEVSPRVYGRMLEEARVALAAGWPVALDAAFLKRHEREDAADLARWLGVPFAGLWMQASEPELRRRLRARTGDASDADGSVLDKQLALDLGEIGWRRVDAEQPVEDQVVAVLAA